MKKLILAGFVVLVGLLQADYQVRTADGDYYVSSRSSKRYVCYRTRIINNNTGGLAYLGCGLYRDNCRSNHKVHFGHYSSNRAARRALRRCQYSNPRIVD